MNPEQNLFPFGIGIRPAPAVDIDEPGPVFGPRPANIDALRGEFAIIMANIFAQAAAEDAAQAQEVNEQAEVPAEIEAEEVAEDAAEEYFSDSDSEVDPAEGAGHGDIAGDHQDPYGA